MPGLWLSALFAFTIAHAQSDDDFDLDDDFEIESSDESTDDETEDSDDSNDTDDDSEDEDVDGIDTAPTKKEEQVDFELEEDLEIGEDAEEEAPPETVGGDSDAEFREAQRRLSRLPADEEIAGWDAYLAQYPNSVYRTRIEERQNELLDSLYNTQLADTTERVEAMDTEIFLTQPLSLDGINPRTRFRGGFEWGIPDYASISAEYEHQLKRNLSVRGGLVRRFSGVNIEVGGKWAFLKSARTQTVVSLNTDLHYNLDPTFPGLRNQIGFGKRIGVVDVQLQAGVDFTLRSDVNAVDALDSVAEFIAPNTTSLQTTFLGGTSVFYRASDRVGVFVETSLNAKPIGADRGFDGGSFSFHTVSFGLKFFPQNKNKPDAQDIEVNVGSNVPFAQNWWQFHQGSLAAQVNAYL